MKKSMLFLVLTIVFLSSCEQDEICVEPTTPRLIIRFYDAENPESRKSVPFLGVKVEGQESFYVDSGISNSPDSIVVPLQVVNDFTKIELVRFANDENPDNNESDFIDVNYQRQEEFVSESCGFRTIYIGVQFQEEPNNSWIQSIQPITDLENIENENRHHLKVYH